MATAPTLEQEFEKSFLDDLDECRALGYDPTDLLRMVHERGALIASRQLLQGKKIPYGFTRLCSLGQAKMTIEAFVHDNPKFHPLFSEKQLANCEARLKSVGYV